jgi:hypothetical protein
VFGLPGYGSERVISTIMKLADVTILTDTGLGCKDLNCVASPVEWPGG